ncbi:metalloregulator ArsR/SmtB family transcription factor [Iamia majanohamensis]|uniref:Metalloregulator ArsR/SmtB family transcription factor n=1 Tax=Iamia majanohamensis TaxID=467976 RepID=A0AAF0BWX7_9ACTN|nr:metalloregulator ArsR/SmtB family transcription factor [Iamia majanohamensis]WCO67974.1 metalloregulator ArsR/SmtB family transcription factor [Iamia majanohamensis]
MDTKIRLQPSLAEFAAAADVLKLVADPTRLHLLWTLVGGEQTVSALAEAVGARPASVSQHLAKLRLGNLVTTRREGNHIHYSLVNDHVARLVGESLLEADHLVGGASHHRGHDR